jgi:nucleoside-diphosphate kinase
MNDIQATLVLIKPDGVERRLVGTILERFERRGLDIAYLKMVDATRAQIANHYAHLLESPHYPRIETWMTRGPLVVVALTGPNAIEVARQTVGATDPLKAAPGTIRAEFGNWIGSNLVHASESVDDVTRERQIWIS